MRVERFVDADGVVRDRQVRPDSKRDVAVGRVVSLSPPAVEVPGRGRVRVHARAVGLTVGVGDWVLCARVEQGVVAICEVEVI